MFLRNRKPNSGVYMHNQTIARIEQEIQSNRNMPEDKKNELLSLISQLKMEMGDLDEEHHEDAKSIASFTETSLHEATREQKDPELLKHSLNGLSLSVRRFEVSHPVLVNLINNIGNTLWNIGI